MHLKDKVPTITRAGTVLKRAIAPNSGREGAQLVLARLPLDPAGERHSHDGSMEVYRVPLQCFAPVRGAVRSPANHLEVIRWIWIK
jgi:hypothetical protein